MKKFCFLFLFISIHQLIFPQCNSSAEVDPDITLIQNESRKTKIVYPGLLSYEYDFQSENGYFESGDTSLFSTGFLKGIWIGGKDPSNNVQVSAVTYNPIGKNDFTPGPIEHSDSDLKDIYCSFFNKTWIIKKSEIFNLIIQYENNNLSIDQIPENILYWPALNNPFITDFQINEPLAPFFDRNGDNVYNPLDGDHPLVSESSPELIPFVFGFRVFNDNSPNLETLGLSLGVEVQHFFYVLNCSELGPSNDAIFHKVKIIYKGFHEIRDVRIGLWEDNDLGCFYDDYIGFSEYLNAAFVYNSNNSDMDLGGPCNAVNEEWTAIRSTVVFNKKIDRYMYYQNGGVGTPPIISIEPYSPLEYYRFLDGRWKDGRQLTKGGLGIDINNEVSNYAFSDCPSDSLGWSMQSESFPFMDTRSLSSFTLSTMKPGEVFQFDFADHIYVNTESNSLQEFKDWESEIEVLKSEYENIISNSATCFEYQTCEDNCVWPGDVNTNGIVNGVDYMYLGYIISWISQHGPARNIISNQWQAYNSSDWLQAYNNINTKHADINGNGTVNKFDFSGLIGNYYRVNESWQSNNDLFANESAEGLVIQANLNNQKLVDFESFSDIFDRFVNFEISIGEVNTPLKTPLHGLSFEMEIDTSFLISFQNKYNLKSTFDESYSFLFGQVLPRTDGLNDFPPQSAFAFTNLSSENLEKGKQLIQHNYVLREDINTINEDGRDTIVFKIKNADYIDSIGNISSLGVQAMDSIIIYNLPVIDPITSIYNNDFETQYLEVFPNPVKDILTLQFNHSFKLLQIVNHLGKVVYMYKGTSKDIESVEIDVFNLPKGIYFINYSDKSGNSFVKRFIKI